MDKIRIKELADQMSLDVKDILNKCKELSIVARTQSSSISLDDANKIKISIVGKPINSNLQKENDIVKRSGSRVTIRRKKKEPIKEKPKEPAQPQIESKETVKEESKENNKRPEKKVLKTVDLENFSNDNRVDKSDKNNNVIDKEISQKEEKKQATTSDFKKKDLPPATKDVTKQKKKPKVKPSKAEIIDEDALDALRSAVKAKLPGARKEFLVSNNYSKKTKTKDNLKEDEGIESDSDNNKKKPKTKKIKIQEKILITLLASKMKVKLNEVIKKASDLGLTLTFKDEIDSDDATIIASEFDYDVEVDTFNEKQVISDGISINEKDIKLRPPIITVMGHVDHGKTSLLDYIRKSKVANKEYGGITQSIGAYSFKFNDKELVFIDTPGHAAF